MTSALRGTVPRSYQPLRLAIAARDPDAALLADAHRRRPRAAVAEAVGAADRDRVDPAAAAAGALGAQPHVVRIEHLPVDRGVAVTERVRVFVARDRERAGRRARQIAGRVADGH